ncbi:MAG: hypothetical protein IH604_15850 [Burkholderiales bacterium]|nr:hypothetical protein [Burkholderiales bacterium]
MKALAIEFTGQWLQLERLDGTAREAVDHAHAPGFVREADQFDSLKRQARRAANADNRFAYPCAPDDACSG